MINSTVSPQVYCIKSIKGRFTQVNLSNAKKYSLICFPRISFRGLIYCDQDPLWLLNVIESVCYIVECTCIRLSTRCKISHINVPLS